MDSLDEAEQVFDQQMEMTENQFQAGSSEAVFVEDVSLEDAVLREHDMVLDGEMRTPFEELLGPDSFSVSGMQSSLELASHVPEEQLGTFQDYYPLHEQSVAEENLGPAGPLDAPGPESLEQVMDVYQTQAMDGHSSDLAGIPSTNSNSPAPEFYSADMFETMQEGMAGLEMGSPSFVNEINNAMDRAASPLGDSAMEPDLFGQSDSMMEAQQIFDEQMQFMEDPFMPDMMAPPCVVPGL